MYKAQYLVVNEKGCTWHSCQSEAFVEEIDGELEYITLFKNKQDAIQVAKEWHNIFHEDVRVVKWNRTSRRWEIVDFKM